MSKTDTLPLLSGEPVIIDPESQQIHEDHVIASQLAQEELTRSLENQRRQRYTYSQPNYYYYGTWRYNDPAIPRRRPIVYVEDELYLVWMWVLSCMLLWFVVAALASVIFWYT